MLHRIPIYSIFQQMKIIYIWISQDESPSQEKQLSLHQGRDLFHNEQFAEWEES